MAIYQDIVRAIGFSAKENAENIFIKTYENGYSIEVNFSKNQINYGNTIQIGRDNCLLLGESHEENTVTLECVDKLLMLGYKPENIFLEKAYPAGRGVTKYLDILVYQDEKPYLMIECKTYGEEFDKELKNTQKNGGQLFTYFQQDTKTELLMLYASDIVDNKIVKETKIIKIEDEYRNAGSVKEAHNIWDKKFYEKGFWENPPYNFKDEIFTKLQLRKLTEDEGKKLFHGFATILRKHSVSDKPNAFNVIFNLFLAKLYDEQKRDDDELDFQWKKNDNPVDFQVRLYNLHKEGLNDFLKKEIEGIYDKDFEAKTVEDLYKAKKKVLKFNKLFDIKSVFDDNDFEQNHRVLREVVEMLQKYQIRYPRKQKYLSEFFELLLTTGLKQEVGQYFTPPPITKFIVKSLPLPTIIEQEVNNPTPKLPAVIDYAAGSGHFITEIMEEYQDIINGLDTKQYFPKAVNQVESWRADPYSWAATYAYGVEKDYRLVKVAKVGCYFYGDGLAQIIHGDGLDSLTNPPKSYIGLLEQNTNTEDSTKNKFSVVVANPPYSVKYCKEDLEYINSQNEFTLYPYLTDNSNEIECLFVERTKQLLKDGGLAGIILPSSILSNTGIYTKTREIILQYLEIIAVAELGSNTFMATGTNTVVLFLRRRSNYEIERLKNSWLEPFFDNLQDVNPTVPFNVMEKPVHKYVNYVWEGFNFDDYISLLKKQPNEKIENSDKYREYRKKLKFKNETEFWNKLLEIEKDKLLYFVLVHKQQVVLVKTGKGNDEKHFLGYEFSNAKGNEGMHSMQRSKSIDDCTQLYNEKDLNDETKASFYIYNAFSGKFPEIDESLKNNISYANLVDMLTFDRFNFEKSVNLNAKKKVKFDSKFDTVLLDDLVSFQSGLWKGEKGDLQTIKVLRNTNFQLNNGKLFYDDVAEIEVEKQQLQDRLLEFGDIILEKSGGSDTQAIGRVVLFDKKETEIYSFSNFCSRIRVKGESINPIFLWLMLNDFYNKGGTIPLQNGVRLLNIDLVGYSKIKIPLPPKEIQEKIVAEIEVLEKEGNEGKIEIEELQEKIDQIIDTKFSQNYKLGDIISLEYGIALPDQNRIKGVYPVVGSNGTVGWHNNFLVEAPAIVVGRKGSAGKINWIDKNCTPIDTTFFVRKMDDVKYSLRILYYAIKKMDLESLVGGTGVPGLNRNDAYAKEINLPPLSEQQKIVSKIEKLEAQISELEQQLSEIPKQKEAILKKYL
ncbi:restriction endonuclease [Bacteroidia bacterium]|nr:restriction endonuclease [Bacteroidia bacterium]